MRHGYEDLDWLLHACLGATFDVLLNLLLVWRLTIFLDAVSDMQTPFGAEGLDMPGLSYVCASAELSLRMVYNSTPTSKPSKHGLFKLLNSPLKKDVLMRRAIEEEASTRKEEQAEEEEEEDGGGE